MNTIINKGTEMIKQEKTDLDVSTEFSPSSKNRLYPSVLTSPISKPTFRESLQGTTQLTSGQIESLVINKLLEKHLGVSQTELLLTSEDCTVTKKQPKQNEQWKLITTICGKDMLWLKYGNPKTIGALGKLYNQPKVLLQTGYRNIKINVFDIYCVGTDHITYYTQKISTIPTELQQQINQSILSGVPIVQKNTESGNHLPSIENILNRYSENPNEREDLFRYLCDKKRSTGKLNDIDRSKMVRFNITKEEINQEIGFVRKSHTFTTETKAKLNTYNKRG